MHKNRDGKPQGKNSGVSQCLDMSEIFFIRYTGGETLGLDMTGKCLAWDSTALLLYILCNINMCLHPEFSPIFHVCLLKLP